MNKKVGIVIFAILSLVANIVAPILMVKLYKTYTKKSEIYGSATNYDLVSGFTKVDDYVFQENLSSMNFVLDEESGYYVFSYNFESKDFDAIENSYQIFVNDYCCSLTSLTQKSIKGEHTREFKDINGNILNTTKINVEFEFYSTYSTLVVKVDTSDIAYFYSFIDNPGFILTLSKINYATINVAETSQQEISPTYLVKFMVDNEFYRSYNVEEGQRLLTLPDAPIKEHYEFIGWTIDGESIVDVQLQEFEEDVTYSAVFQRLCCITFRVDNISYSSNNYRIGDTVVLPVNPTKEDYTFIGWSIDGETIIDFTNYVVSEDKTFVALFTRSYPVTFMVDGEVYNTQQVIRGGTVIAPASPTKENYTFRGWSLDNSTVVNLSSHTVQHSETFVALFVSAERSVFNTNINTTVTATDSLGVKRNVFNGDDIARDSTLSFKLPMFYTNLEVVGGTYTHNENNDTYTVVVTDAIVSITADFEITGSPSNTDNVYLATNSLRPYTDCGRLNSIGLMANEHTLSRYLQSFNEVPKNSLLKFTFNAFDIESVSFTNASVVSSTTDEYNNLIYLVQSGEENIEYTINWKACETTTLTFDSSYIRVYTRDNLVDLDSLDINGTEIESGSSVRLNSILFVKFITDNTYANSNEFSSDYHLSSNINQFSSNYTDKCIKITIQSSESATIEFVG